MKFRVIDKRTREVIGSADEDTREKALSFAENNLAMFGVTDDTRVDVSFVETASVSEPTSENGMTNGATQRTRLGELDLASTSPYDLAVVLVDYIRVNFGNEYVVGIVEHTLRHWRDAQVNNAEPELSTKLEHAKDALIDLKSKCDATLLRLEKLPTGERDERTAKQP